MPDLAGRVPVAGLSELCEQFRDLDAVRRRSGLSLSDAERYRVLFERLSDALAMGERQRKADARQFLRIPFPMEVIIRRPGRVVCAPCHDFGGGGCAITTDEPFALD